jgi:protein OS-9
MVISTPRLCNDVAFLPPEETKPHLITCTPVLPADAIPSYIAEQESRAAQLDSKVSDFAETIFDDIQDVLTGKASQHQGQIVGDIVVGAHRTVPSGTKLAKGVAAGGVEVVEEKFLATIAKSDGYVATERELNKLNIKNAKEVDKIRKRLESVAKGKEWQLDVFETPQGKELRGIIDTRDDEAGAVDENKGKKAKNEGDDGSEETYKEEL